MISRGVREKATVIGQKMKAVKGCFKITEVQSNRSVSQRFAFRRREYEPVGKIIY